jgi:hypothetical protein
MKQTNNCDSSYASKKFVTAMVAAAFLVVHVAFGSVLLTGQLTGDQNQSITVVDYSVPSVIRRPIRRVLTSILYCTRPSSRRVLSI